ncbi:WXG100 family type VII secretion target [Streptomyces sp. NPDC020965]|uniref:WXG100 family type VII secretion target n=1 Tax=Streptomyces sp. NPDC020965 TaxID=3365105 RepID=UPI0037B7C974
MTQEQLFALLTPVNRDTASTASARLKTAAEALQKIGNELKLRVTLVKWEGEGADAFKDWGSQTANATLRLGDYSAEAGRWMDDVVQAIAEAQSGLGDLQKSAATAESDLGTAKKTHFAAVHDPGAGKDAAKDARTDMDLAQAGMEAARLASVDRLRKLGQTYTQSGEQINKLEPPTFPPPASLLGGEWRYSEKDRGYGRYEGQPGGGGTGGGPFTGTTSPRSTGEVQGTIRTNSDGGGTRVDGATPPPGATQPLPPLPDPTVGLGLDSVVTPDAPTTVAPPGVLPPGGRPDGGGGGQMTPSAMPPGVVPPVLKGNGGGTGPGSGSGGKVPPVTKSGLLPPGVSGGGVVPPRMPMPRGEGGIVGGRPVAQQGTTGPGTGRPAGAIPRGTVIGGEGTTGTRGQMGRGMAGMPGMYGGGGPMGGVGQSGISGGRRLASETGGVVGGRAAQPSGQGGGRPFTPGGSGLVRGAESGRGGMFAAGANTANPRRENDENGERPDYLTEDEETWQQGGRRVVPPVID